MKIPICDKKLWDMRMARLRFPTVSAAVELGLMEALANPLSFGDAAKVMGSTELAAEVLLRVLWADNLIEKTPQGFVHTPIASQHFVKKSPFFWGPLLASYPDEAQMHKQILSAVQKDGERLNFGERSFTEMWESGDIDPEAARSFTHRMHQTIFAPAIFAAKSGVFDGVKRLVDAGGGAGSFGVALTDVYPELEYTLFDLPPVCRTAKSIAKKLGKEASLRYESGNFFKELPSGRDAVLFSNIFHDWRRHHCERLAEVTFGALAPGGRIFLHEMVLEEDKRPETGAAAFGLLMFLNHSGKQYTRQELEEILSRAGFVEFKVTPVFGHFSIVTARKP